MAAENSWFNFPLLVHIQSVKSKELHTSTSFVSGSSLSSSNNEQVTCLEGSNRYLFIGYSSGSTNILLRSKLVNICTIPSQGKKVSNIACSENENYVAIGVSHGKLCVFRLTHHNNQFFIPESDGSEMVKLVYVVTQHTGNEITSLHWSLNEKNLFIGDSCGLVSQLSVELLDQFPRPIPVKSLMEATSRVMQMDYVFPYLAISTVYSVFLCDIESAEFVRVHLRKFRDIKSTGLCFMSIPNLNSNNTDELCLMRLLISEENTGFIHAANMEGVITASYKVSIFTSITMNSTKLFYPIIENNAENENSNYSLLLEEKSNISLGNLLLTDTNYVLSYSHDHICILEPNQLRIVSWITKFNKIQKVKLMSNYIFIWHGSTISLLSLTQFRNYGEQLLNAGLVKVLERWIDYTITSIAGCRQINQHRSSSTSSTSSSLLLSLSEPAAVKMVEDEANKSSVEESNNNELTKHILRNMVGISESEEDEFGLFVYSHTPEHLIPSTFSHSNYFTHSPFVHFVATQMVPILKKMKYSSTSSSSSVEIPNKEDCESNKIHFNNLMTSVKEFYSTQNIFNGIIEISEQLRSSKTTLLQILNQIKQFILSTSKLKIQLKSTPMCIKQCRSMLTNAIQLHFSTIKDLLCPQQPFFQIFVQNKAVLNWFKKFGNSEEIIVQDAIRSDILIFLIPFYIISNSTCSWGTHFFSWLTSNMFLGEQQSCHYSKLMQSLLIDSNNKQNISSSSFYSQMKTLIYRDFFASDISRICKILHHLITLEYFVNDEGRNRKNNGIHVLRKLLTCIPLQHWSKNEIETKLFQMRSNNEELFKMIVEACLAKEDSCELCNCGIPALYGPKSYMFYISSAQHAIDECIFKMLKNDPNRLVSINFGLRRLLVKKILLSDDADLLDEMMIAKILLRSGSCELLQYVKFSPNILNIILDQRSNEVSENCDVCGYKLNTVSSFKQFNFDCIGIWILNNNTLEESIKIFCAFNMNIAGIFTRRFYGITSRSKSRFVNSSAKICILCSSKNNKEAT